MSETINFIEDKITGLTKEINILELKRLEYLDSMNACDAEILEKQNKIDELNTELEKIRITDSDLVTIKNKVINA